MYHPTIINVKIAAAAKQGRKILYHSRAEVEQFIDHMNTTSRELDDRGCPRITRKPDPAETDWIRNERFLCRADFNYFISRYIWIKNEEDQVVRFNPRVAQSIFLDLVAENELARIAVMLICLKARQLGLSRITSLLVLHRMLFFPHVNAVIASSTPEKTRLLGDMLDFAFDRLPYWLVPDVTARREGEFIEFGKVDTGVTLQHGAQMTGIARGTTPTVCHLSELCEFLNPEELVDASLMRSMHDSERTLLILESTALGKHNWWHDTWLSAKEGWPEHRSRLRPCFLPWFVGTDLYPKAAWLRARPIPSDHRFPPWVEDHARKAAEYVDSDPLLKKYLGDGWRMPPEQKWFYEVERGEAVRKDRLNKFFQEMPASDDEAFQSTNISVFSHETLAYHRDRTTNPLGVYGISGPSDLIPARLQPHHILLDTTKSPLSADWTWGNHPYPIRFNFLPLRWNGYSTDSGLDKVYIWELPESGEIYGLGVDTAEGVGKDRTVVQVIRKGSPWRKAAQVAEFATDKLNALDATPFVMALAALYSIDPVDESQPEISFRRQIRVAIECRANGDQTQLKMRLAGWANFHPWQRVDNRELARDQYNKIGVFTNSWFRAALMEYLISMVRDLEIDVRSPFLVKEMESLEADEFRQSLRAAQGAHDDRVMALGFIIISLYQYEKGRKVAEPPKIVKQVSGERRYARYTPGVQESVQTIDNK